MTIRVDLKKKFEMKLEDYLPNCQYSLRNLLTTNFHFLGSVALLKNLEKQEYDFYIRTGDINTSVQFELYLENAAVESMDLNDHPELLKIENYAFGIAHPDTGLYDPVAPMRFWLMNPKKEARSIYVYKSERNSVYGNILEQIQSVSNIVVAE